MYNRVCIACHQGQRFITPKPGVKAEGKLSRRWYNTQGVKAMPPRGLCTDCSVEDYQPIIQRMNE
ncbi:c-type cytochrome [Pseudomonas sp. SIMBA_077]